MKALRYIPIIALLTLAGCQKDKLPKGTPSCIETRVQQMKDQALQTPPMRVVEYEYNQATVYYIPASGACCDIFSELWDSNCNLLCHPDEGLLPQNATDSCPAGIIASPERRR